MVSIGLSEKKKEPKGSGFSFFGSIECALRFDCGRFLAEIMAINARISFFPGEMLRCLSVTDVVHVVLLLPLR